MRTAKCACGGLTVNTPVNPKFVVMCHCTECQRRTGAPFGISAFFDSDDLEISGESTVFERSSDAGRSVHSHFCPNCGTTVYSYMELAPGQVVVAAGCFGDPDFPKPDQVVHAKCKHTWVANPDGVSAFELQTA